MNGRRPVRDRSFRPPTARRWPQPNGLGGPALAPRFSRTTTSAPSSYGPPAQAPPRLTLPPHAGKGSALARFAGNHRGLISTPPLSYRQPPPPNLEELTDRLGEPRRPGDPSACTAVMNPLVDHSGQTLAILGHVSRFEAILADFLAFGPQFQPDTVGSGHLGGFFLRICCIVTCRETPSCCIAVGGYMAERLHLYFAPPHLSKPDRIPAMMARISFRFFGFFAVYFFSKLWGTEQNQIRGTASFATTQAIPNCRQQTDPKLSLKRDSCRL